MKNIVCSIVFCLSMLMPPQLGAANGPLKWLKEKKAQIDEARERRLKFLTERPASKWVNPYTLNPQLRLNEIALVCAHNSYSFTNPRNLQKPNIFNYIYAQQSLSIVQQLALGVRGLDFDTYEDTEGKYEKGEIYLMHGGFNIDPWLRGAKGVAFKRKNPPMTLYEALSEVRTFLVQHPQEILIINFENYVKPYNNPIKLYKKIAAAGLTKFLLTPADWDPVARGGWPTLEWMVQNNKRLVLVDDYATDSKIIWQLSKHFASTQFGTLDIEIATPQSDRSFKFKDQMRYFFIAILIPTFLVPLPEEEWSEMSKEKRKAYRQSIIDELKKTLNHREVNGPRLARFIKSIQQKHARLPNLIFLDFVHQGKAFERVNSINEKSALSPEFRKKWFKVFRSQSSQVAEHSARP